MQNRIAPQKQDPETRDSATVASGAAQWTGLQLLQTALTNNAMPQCPDARMLPNSQPFSCLWTCQLQALVGRRLLPACTGPTQLVAVNQQPHEDP
jgi:hypothetical protein